MVCFFYPPRNKKKVDVAIYCQKQCNREVMGVERSCSAEQDTLPPELSLMPNVCFTQDHVSGTINTSISHVKMSNNISFVPLQKYSSSNKVDTHDWC